MENQSQKPSGSQPESRDKRSLRGRAYLPEQRVAHQIRGLANLRIEHDPEEINAELMLLRAQGGMPQLPDYTSPVAWAHAVMALLSEEEHKLKTEESFLAPRVRELQTQISSCNGKMGLIAQALKPRVRGGDKK